MLLGKIAPIALMWEQTQRGLYYPTPTLKMSEARHKPIRIGQGAVSRGFGVSHVGPAGCGVCGSTPYVRSMYLQYYCIMCIMSKRDRCDDPNGAEPFAWLILYL